MDGLNKEMRDPFVLNPEETVSAEQREKSKDGFSIKKIEGIDGWTGMGLMAVANTRVVRRSAALMEQNQKHLLRPSIMDLKKQNQNCHLV